MMMLRPICGVKWMAIVGVTFFAASLADAKPPKTSPPPQPNLGGVIYFQNRNGGQMWQMNGNGGDKTPAVIPSGLRARPSSRLYNGERWWLCSKDMDSIPETMDSELFAYQFRADGTYDEVQLTDITKDGFSVKETFDEIQWSNNGLDSFCSVLVCDPLLAAPYPRWSVWRFSTNPALFGMGYPLTGILEGTFALDEYNDRTSDVIDPLWWSPSEYSWSPSGSQIAYSHPLEASNYKLRIKTFAATNSYRDIPLSMHKVEKLSNVCWSPNGARISFYAWIRGSDGVLRCGEWTVLPDGTDLNNTDLKQFYVGYETNIGGKKWSLDSAWNTYKSTTTSGTIKTGLFIIKPDKSQGPYDLLSDMPVSKRNPEKWELVDWVGTENVLTVPLP